MPAEDSKGIRMTTLATLSESEKNRVRITDVKAMQLKDQAGQSLVKVETDAGVHGIGEAGASGPMVRHICNICERHLSVKMCLKSISYTPAW